jgi:hypothetical protein
MKIIDSIIVLASLDPNHKHYRKAVFYLQKLRSAQDVFIPENFRFYMGKSLASC